MAKAFKLPDLGEGIHEAEVTKVLVSAGDQVEEEQTILAVETDKAAVEIPSPYSGVVEDVKVKAGDLVRVGDVLMTFDGTRGAEAEEEPVKEGVGTPPLESETGERVITPTAASEAGQPARPEAGEVVEEEKEMAEPSKGERGAGRRGAPARPAPDQRGAPIPASPATRRLARELDVNLAQVSGSGPGGLVTAEDVRVFAERGPAAEEAPAAPVAEERRAQPRGEEAERSAVCPAEIEAPPLPDFSRWGPVERVELRLVRRATAKQMALAWSYIPHVTHMDVADITELEHLRNRYKNEIKEQGGRLTVTVFALKAVATALQAFPHFNASLDKDCEQIIVKHYYHLRVAVDTDRGLLVPVIRDVDCKSVRQLSKEVYELVQRTRNGEATLEEMQGGTFTITNIGALGGTGFTPIIYYPEVAILGLAEARWQPLITMDEDGDPDQGKFQIAPRLMLPIVLAFDHRVVDGADAARFVNKIIEALENPEKLLMAL